ncbi:B-cell receptor CD22-like isoform X3 [Salvelinus alpinus]|uniref:B-cell receptor CD22-like isoform X3 n=1 Tax=Salvelinus alpinus TaxID=8036 RepID=UPI0039FD1392
MVFMIVNVNSDMACSTDNMFLIGLFMSGVLACFGHRHLITTMPEKLDVLSGSCVQIPCAFDVPQDCSTFNSTVITSGVWIKESPNFGGSLDNVIFNSSKTDNTYQGKITGNMSWKACTTVFFNVTTSYNNSYFFRIESKPFRATDPDKSVLIVVRVSPKNTSASLSPAYPVSVGSCVNLTCSSTANPPVTNFTWFQICGGKPTRVASGQTYTLNVTVGDGGMYYCEARNYHGIEKSMKVLLAIEGQEEPLNPRIWGIAGAGGTLGVILLIILITFFGWKRKSRLPDGLERIDNPLGQNSTVGMMYTNQAMTREEPEEPAEDQPEEIHYGEIDFSKLRPKETPAAALDREQEQESEYAEVSVTGRGAQEPPVNNLDGVYAQVNKKSAF